MVICGNATVFITNMDAAIRFYTETLGMNLKDSAKSSTALKKKVRRSSRGGVLKRQ
jgi:predicted enzyme related to lactoylglutathione lyase